MVTATDKVAERFRDMADRLQGEIDGKRASRRENTPKQQKEARAQRIDADHLERVQKAMLVLADAREAGRIPEGLASIKSKSELLGMLRTIVDGSSGGYYSIVDTGKYRDESELARNLREFVKQETDSPEARAKAESDAKLRRIQELEADVKFRPIPGFFPTPGDVIATMLDRADIQPGQWVLEPSAGKGDIVDMILYRIPRAEIGLDVLEINHTLYEILCAKGFHCHRVDFLTEWGAKTKYDRIVMNPPFENGQDIDHLRHAYDLLKDGGRVVSVMCSGSFYRSDRKSTEFREWLSLSGGHSEPLPAESFKDSFRSTGVSCLLVTIDK